jgi:hypothetical protein
MSASLSIMRLDVFVRGRDTGSLPFLPPPSLLPFPSKGCNNKETPWDEQDYLFIVQHLELRFPASEM